MKTKYWITEEQLNSFQELNVEWPSDAHELEELIETIRETQKLVTDG